MTEIIENSFKKQIDKNSFEQVWLNFDEIDIINKIREIRNQKEFKIGYEKDILFLIDILNEISKEEKEKDFGWTFHLNFSDKKEIKNGIKLGISRSISKEYQKRHPDSKLGGRKSRIDMILSEIHFFGYWLLTEKGNNHCIIMENDYKKSTIYEALRNL